MFGGFHVGSWFGFKIKIDYSWFVVFALVTWTFSAFEFPESLPGLGEAAYLSMGIAGALLLFLSVLLHELAHSAVARSRGIPVEGITLFIFGGVAEMRMEARRPIDEFLLTVVGPLSSMALAGVFFTLSQAMVALDRPAVATVAGTLSVLNLVLAVFNLIPAFPLDGGRLLRSVIWRLNGDLGVATHWATAIGRAFGWLLILAGLFLFLQRYTLAGAWGVLLGWFLTGAATSAARQNELRRSLEGVTVERVMRPDSRVVPAEMSVAEMADIYLLRSAAGAYPVVRGGRIIGLVALADVAELAPAERPLTPVFEVMHSMEHVPEVEADAPVVDVLMRMQGGKEDRALVVRAGELIGVLTLPDIAAWIERAQKLGLKPQRRR